MFRLLTTNTKFYDYFDRITEILVRAAERFQVFTADGEHAERCAAEMKRLEHEADEVTHDVLALLHRSFITPLEPGDIRRLVESLDDVLDLLDDASRRILLYDLPGVLPEVRDLARILLEATQTVQTAVAGLRTLQKKNNGIVQACIEIRRLENEADQVNHEALARLFKSDFDPFMVLKWKDVIVDVETAIDRCQDVSNVLEGIVLENT
jgi:predicted phosphate transport protein (TIGR00153 family)